MNDVALALAETRITPAERRDAPVGDSAIGTLAGDGAGCGRAAAASDEAGGGFGGGTGYATSAGDGFGCGAGAGCGDAFDFGDGSGDGCGNGAGSEGACAVAVRHPRTADNLVHENNNGADHDAALTTGWPPAVTPGLLEGRETDAPGYSR